MTTGEKFAAVLFCLTVVVCGISIPWSIAWYYTVTTKAAIQSGYEEQTLQGTSGVHWVKSKNNNTENN